ncbi:MAG TPA: hypothetical protein VFG05_06260 [Methylocella sp.]|nr:hypothetical protein [Methylocella sp.]
MTVSAHEITALAEAQRWEDLEHLLETALPRAAGQTRVAYLVHLARAYEATGRRERARETVAEAEDYIKECRGLTLPLGWWIGLVAAHEKRQDYEAAIALLSRILAEQPVGDNGSAAALKIKLLRLKHAQRIHAQCSSLPVRILALGQNCLPDNLIARWGLGALSVEGPFHAGVFRGDGVAKALEEDFSAFFSRASYVVNKTASGVPVALLPAYNTLFNHETGDAWVDGSLMRLRQLYAKRIGNFRDALQQSRKERLLFIHTLLSSASPARLLYALEKIAPGRAKRLVVFDFLNSHQGSEDAFPEGARRICTAYPKFDGGYVWHWPHHYDTETGLAFEKSLIDPVVREIEGLRQ